MKGQFTYDEDKGTMRFQNVTGGVGRSSFSEMTGQLSLEKVPSIEVLSGNSLLEVPLQPFSDSPSLFDGTLLFPT
jgi:hypothetical protein